MWRTPDIFLVAFADHSGHGSIPTRTRSLSALRVFTFQLFWDNVGQVCSQPGHKLHFYEPSSAFRGYTMSFSMSESAAGCSNVRHPHTSVPTGLSVAASSSSLSRRSCRNKDKYDELHLVIWLSTCLHEFHVVWQLKPHDREIQGGNVYVFIYCLWTE